MLVNCAFRPVLSPQQAPCPAGIVVAEKQHIEFEQTRNDGRMWIDQLHIRSHHLSATGCALSSSGLTVQRLCWPEAICTRATGRRLHLLLLPETCTHLKSLAAEANRIVDTTRFSKLRLIATLQSGPVLCQGRALQSSAESTKEIVRQRPA